MPFRLNSRHACMSDGNWCTPMVNSEQGPFYSETGQAKALFQIELPCIVKVMQCGAQKHVKWMVHQMKSIATMRHPRTKVFSD